MSLFFQIQLKNINDKSLSSRQIKIVLNTSRLVQQQTQQRIKQESLDPDNKQNSILNRNQRTQTK